MQITIDDMKYYFKNHGIILPYNQKRILELYAEMEKEDDLEQIISLKSFQYSEGTRQKEMNDLSDVLEKVKKMQREKTLDIRAEFQTLIEENERINRLMICYRALSTINFVGHEIVRKMYLEAMTYEAVEMESGLSHKTFETKRKQAMNTIKMLFESDYTNNQILTKIKYMNIRVAMKPRKNQFRQLNLKLD